MKTQKNHKIRRRTLRGGSKEIKDLKWVIRKLIYLIHNGVINDEFANFILYILNMDRDYIFTEGTLYSLHTLVRH